MYTYTQDEQDRDDAAMAKLAEAVAASPGDYADLSDGPVRRLAACYELSPLAVREVITAVMRGKHVPPTDPEAMTPERAARAINRLPPSKRVGAWIGWELRRTREQLGLSPHVVAAYVHVDGRTLQSYERGARLNVERLYLWCARLNLVMSAVVALAERRMREFPSDVP